MLSRSQTNQSRGYLPQTSPFWSSSSRERPWLEPPVLHKSPETPNILASPSDLSQRGGPARTCLGLPLEARCKLLGPRQSQRCREVLGLSDASWVALHWGHSVAITLLSPPCPSPGGPGAAEAVAGTKMLLGSGVAGLEAGWARQEREHGQGGQGRVGRAGWALQAGHDGQHRVDRAGWAVWGR